MKFETILIDIDNTLLDFSASEKIAFNKLLNGLNIPYSVELEQHYKKINHKLWSDYEKGLITSDTIKEQRFAKSLEHFNLPYSGLELDAMFRNHIEENTVLIPNAPELLEAVADDYNLVVVTNGIASSQYQRLVNAKMIPYFDYVAVSSEIGFTKPSNEFFTTLLKEFPHINQETTLIVGDSLSADIQGGINWGIKTCWFNPNNAKNTTHIKPDFEVTDLMQVLEIVSK